MASALCDLLGDKLLSKRAAMRAGGPWGTELTARTLELKEHVMLYFSASWCGPCNEFTPTLVEKYLSSGDASKVEVVFVSADDDEPSFDRYYKEMPWLALPFADRDRETALRQKYFGDNFGIPSAVVLDAHGNLVTTDGRAMLDRFFQHSAPELVRIAVGEAWEPHRMMINHTDLSQRQWDAGQSMSVAGWAHKQEFWAFKSPQPGTIRIAVGEAWEPHRMMINHTDFSQSQWDAGQSMSVAGWTHKQEFWAFKTPQPGTIRIAVGEAWEPHRMMINHTDFSQSQWDAGQSMSVAGWTHKQEFWAYPSPP